MKKMIICDLDGTLYDIRKVRLAMAFRLAGHYLFHLTDLKEAHGLWIYRKYRNHSDMSEYDIYALIDTRLHIPVKTMRNIVWHWMVLYPLDLINRYRYDRVLEYIKAQRENGCKLAVYSDNPVSEKLNILEIRPDMIFYIRDIYEKKPSGKAADFIKKQAGKSELVYIGDDRKKDAVSAALLGAHYIDVRKIA